MITKVSQDCLVVRYAFCSGGLLKTNFSFRLFFLRDEVKSCQEGVFFGKTLFFNIIFAVHRIRAHSRFKAWWSLNLLGSKTRTSSAPKLNPQRMPSHGNTMESQIQSFPEQVRRCDLIRPTAEQAAPHSEPRRHSTAIGCLLLSINPTLLTEMSGNKESLAKHCQSVAKHRQG